MRMRCAFLLPFLFVACSREQHPLAGNWTQVTADAKAGMTLEFEVGGTRLNVHTAPAADGGHDHVHGTYTFDAATKQLTVQAPLLGAGKAEAWSGSIDAGKLQLSSPDGKLAFQHKEGDYHH